MFSGIWHTIMPRPQLKIKIWLVILSRILLTMSFYHAFFSGLDLTYRYIQSTLVYFRTCFFKTKCSTQQNLILNTITWLVSTEEDVIEISKIPCVNLDSIQKQLDLVFYDRAPGKDIYNQVIHTQT